MSPQSKVNYNTDYYRRNKEKRFKVHKCPHCDYETTGPKSSLQKHIYAKHTPEHLRPYQCSHCERGFAQKSNLQKHLFNQHSIKSDLVQDRTICLYTFEPGPFIPTAKKTLARYNLYLERPVIKATELSELKYSDRFLTADKIRYDVREGYIKIQTYTKKDIQNIRRRS